MNDIICAAFSSDGRSARTASIWQYDRGRMLQLTGLELPASYEVQFANCPQATTKRVVVYDTDTIVIPEEFTQLGEPVYVYIYNNSDKYGLTERLAIVPVKKRGPLSDEEPDPDQADTIGSLIGALNGAVEQTAQDVADTTAAKEAAEAAAEAAENYSNVAGQHAQDASASKDAAQIAQTGAETAKADAETAAASASASATDAILLKNQAELAAQNAEESARISTEAVQTNIQLKNQAQVAEAHAREYADDAMQGADEAWNAVSQASEYSRQAGDHASNAEAAQEAAEYARDEAQEAIAHGPKIEDDTWYVWDQSSESYVYTGVRAVGRDATSVVVGIKNFVIHCDQHGRVKEDETVNVRFWGFVGNNRAQCTYLGATGRPAGLDITHMNDADTGSLGGLLNVEYHKGRHISIDGENDLNGTFKLRFRCNNIDFDVLCTWSSVCDGAKGDSYNLTEEDKAEIATLVDGMHIHICTSQEYNSETGVPTIANPDTETFYLVPGGDGNNLFIEWAYVNGAWERFGSADVDLSNYVQKTDYATNSTAGVVKVAGLGVKMSNDELIIAPASSGQMKRGSGDNAPIVAAKEHEATFYGLAKAAGDSTQSQSSNAVGTYTDEAKAAIRNMIGAPALEDIPEALVQDVQVADTSVVENGVANVPIGDNDTFGVYKTGGYGVTVSAMPGSEGTLAIAAAVHSEIKTGNGAFKPITASKQHTATFYGLAKAAGADEKDSTLPVGQYTDTAKTAIRNMIGATSENVVAVQDEEPSDPDTKIWIPETADAPVQIPTVEDMNEALAEKADVEDIPEVPVQDVQVNGTSVLNDGVANVDAVIIPGTGIGSAKTRDFEEDGHTYVNEGSGMGSFAEGLNTHATGLASHSENQQTYANGDNSHAEGLLTFANGLASHAEGRDMYAFGDCSHAEGGGSAKVVKFTGDANTVKYVVSVFIPVGTIVKRGELGDAIVTQIEDIDGVFFATLDKTLSGSNALENQRMQTFIGGALESHSHVEGSNSIALSVGQHVEGRNNEPNGDYAHIVGNGSTSTQRSNAYALDWDGNGHYMGDVYVHANADSTGGTKLATIDDVGVQDVQVNGVSVLQDGVANVPIASANANGVVLVDGNRGLGIEANGRITIQGENDSDAKGGWAYWKCVTPARQHASTFYGLAKAAGDSTQSASSNAVGQYTDAAKAAIQSMLGISQMLAPVNPNMTAAQAYGVGEVFAANGKLYKATAAIAQDAAIIPDTNCEETTMVDESVRDVQVNGTSIVSGGVANVPLGNTSTVGVVKMTPQNFTVSNSGQVTLSAITAAEYKAGVSGWAKGVQPNSINALTFYGLSKVAGVDLANETVTLGQYPEASKTAIKAMLGVEEGLKVVRLI